MKKITNKDGSPRFNFDQQLSSQQIKGYFTRLAKANRSKSSSQVQEELDEDEQMDDDSQRLSSITTSTQPKDEEDEELDDNQQEDDDDTDEYDSGVQYSHSNTLRSEINSLLDHNLHDN